MKLRTKEEFMARFRGVPANVLARTLNRLTPGINWTGCSKGRIAEGWASPTYAQSVGLFTVTLDQIQDELNGVRK